MAEGAGAAGAAGVEPRAEGRPARTGARIVLVATARTLVAVSALLLVYFQMPLEDRDHLVARMVSVVIGLLAFAAILVRQVRRIRRAEYPMVRAVEAVVLVGSLFCVAIASAHQSMSLADPSSYSEPLDRVDALYFTVTTLATVGFGDITPTSTLTRSVTTVQIVLGVALLGAGVRALLGVAQQVKAERLRDAAAE